MVEVEKKPSEELKKRIRKRNRGKKNEPQRTEEEEEKTQNVEENSDEIQKKRVKKVKLQGRGIIEEQEEEEAEEEVEAKEEEEEEKIVIVGKGIMTNQTFESLDLSEHTFEAIKSMGFQHMTQVRKVSTFLYSQIAKPWSLNRLDLTLLSFRFKRDRSRRFWRAKMFLVLRGLVLVKHLLFSYRLLNCCSKSVSLLATELVSLLSAPLENLLFR